MLNQLSHPCTPQLILLFKKLLQYFLFFSSSVFSKISLKVTYFSTIRKNNYILSNNFSLNKLFNSCPLPYKALGKHEMTFSRIPSALCWVFLCTVSQLILFLMGSLLFTDCYIRGSEKLKDISKAFYTSRNCTVNWLNHSNPDQLNFEIYRLLSVTLNI